MLAILSDLHGNLEALEAVLADAATFRVDRICCLGDLVGYGPDPIPCINHAMCWDCVVRGQFDDAAISDDDLSGWTALGAKQTVLRFRSQLREHPRRAAITEFLSSLPTSVTTPEALFVHGSPRNRLYDSLFPEDVYNSLKMESVAYGFEGLCFCGRTHLSGLFQRGGGGWTFSPPTDSEASFRISGARQICNVGSVGQPRDGDPRACYVLFTPGKITFRRVGYDIDRTRRKIRDQGDDDFPGQRLTEGR